MPDNQYPRVLYHEDGRQRVVRSKEEEDAAPGFTAQMNDNVTMAMRQAAGSIAEVIEPVRVEQLRRTNK